MNILGINDGHNASACLLVNGEIRYCIQEERLTNIKNYMGFPFKSINRILQLSNFTPEEIDIVAILAEKMWIFHWVFYRRLLYW